MILKKFFLNWYGPNNATVTIGGDIDVKSTLELAVKYFGPIPKGPEVSMPKKPKVTLDSDRYISMQDNVHLPLLYISYPTVSVRDADEAALDLLAEILGGGKTSLFYKNMVKNQLAVNAGVSHPCAELACTFNMFALPHPASGKSLADLEKIMRDSLVEFEKRGVQPDDLAKAKAKMEANFIFGLQSVSGKVSQLAANQTFTGNPNYIEQDIKRYANVTKQDVDRVFNQYIKGHHAVIMSVVPNGQLDAVAHTDNFKAPVRQLVKESETSADELALRKAKDNFDRSQIPLAKANAPVSVPMMWQQETATGIKILGTQSNETPTTSLLIQIPAGHYYENQDKAGTASLLANMLNESTNKRSAEDMSKALQLLGSNVSIYANNFTIDINVNALTKNIDATMELVKEKLLQPAFLKDEFARNQKNAIQGIKNGKKNASYLASSAYRQLLNADNIAAMPVGGTETSMSAISLDDVRNFYQTHIKPFGTELIVVSDRTEKELAPTIAFLNDWKGQGPKLNLVIAESPSKKGVVYLVNKDKAAQSAIRIGKRDIKQDITGEFYRSYLMNFPLGGAFNSRINLNLREDKGYTYGARGYFWGNKLTGGYTASAEVRANVTDKSIVEFINEIKRYHDQGITDEELEFMRNAINQKDALKYETPRAKLRFLAQILEYNLTPKFVADRAEIVRKITKQEINALAKKHLVVDDMIILVVGDAKTLRPELEALGYEVVDYSIR
ncbi:MAG: insulinase family protein [Enterobacterales bacterium]|nr:insulinase family protein [Enterobacterales bacterium]